MRTGTFARHSNLSEKQNEQIVDQVAAREALTRIMSTALARSPALQALAQPKQCTRPFSPAIAAACFAAAIRMQRPWTHFEPRRPANSGRPS